MKLNKFSSRLLTLITIPIFLSYGLFGILGSSNVLAAGSNLVANPLVETADPGNTSSPLDWQTGSWGTNTSTFSYNSTGSNGDANSVTVNTSSYTSGDSKWYFNPVNITGGSVYNYSDNYQSTTASSVVVAFTMSDGTNQYIDIGDLAASSAWTTFSANFTAPSGVVNATVYHLINSVGSLTTDNFSLTASSAPTISITAPTANGTVSGTNVGLTASVSDTATITGVQFQVNGTNVGNPVTSAPYTYNWNSESLPNGQVSITAIVTDSLGNSATAAPVNVEISNANPINGNLIPNPLMTTVDPANTSQPLDWSLASWGTNSFTSSYSTTGGSTGDPDSLTINMTSYTSGDAKWIFTPQTVQQDTQYQFSDYYKSTVQTQVDAVFTMSDGTTEYEIIGLPGPATSWTQFSSKFSVPYGAVNVTIYHFIQSVGSLSIDNADMSTYVPQGFTRPIVTLTFDDGYKTIYTNALPLLKADGFTSTQFIITDLIGTKGYMTAAQLKTFSGDGDEMASHTVTHDDMTQETAATLTTELSQSQTTLKTDTGVSPTDMAYPYGLYNAQVMAATQKYYQAARGVESGLNSKDNFNAYDLKVEDVYTTTTTAQITDWVNQAIATKTWLIFVYHGVDANVNNAVDGDIYDVPPTQLSAQLAAIKASGVTVETMAKALAEVKPQL